MPRCKSVNVLFFIIVSLHPILSSHSINVATQSDVRLGTQYHTTAHDCNQTNNVGCAIQAALLAETSVPMEPDKPLVSEPYATDKTTTAVVSWNYTGVADSFTVTMCIGSSCRRLYTCDNSPCTATELESGAAYFATVVANSGDRSSNSSKESERYRTYPPTPEQVTLSQPVDGDVTTRLSVSWSMPLKPNQFRVNSYEIILHPSTGSEIKYIYSNETPYHYVVEGLVLGEIYNATVMSISPSAGPPSKSSNLSLVSNNQQTGVLPMKPEGVVVNEPSATSKTTTAVVSWKYTETVDNFTVAMCIVNSSLPCRQRVCDESPCIVTGLASGASYFATVAAHKGNLTSGLSEVSNIYTTFPMKSSKPVVSEPYDTDKTTTAVVSWNYTGMADNFTVEMCNGSSCRGPYICDKSPCTVTDLEPGAAYVATVAANSGDRASNSSEESDQYRTFPMKPDKPVVSEPYATDKTTTAVVSWNYTGRADNFTVTMCVGQSCRGPYTCDNSPCTVTDLEPGAAYVASVVANSGDRSSNSSESSNNAQYRTYPPTPVQVKLSQPVDGDVTMSLNVSWSMPLEPNRFRVTSYEIILYPSTGSEIKYTHSSGTPYYIVVGGLVPGEVYNAAVRSISPSTGAPSKTSNLSLVSNNQRTVPKKPNKPLVSEPSETSKTTTAVVSWNYTETVDNFTVAMCNGSSAFSCRQHNCNNSSCTVTDLEPGAAYNATVTANIGDLSSDPSDTFDQYVTNPDKVKVLKTIQDKISPTKKLEVTWMSPDGVGDKIEICYKSTKSDSTCTNTENFVIKSTILDVEPGYNYTINVTSISKSVKSEVVEDSANSKPSQPTNVTIDTSSSMLNFNWEKPEGNAELIYIEPANDDSSFKKVTLPGNSVSYNVEGLKADTKYTVNIYSAITNSLGMLEFSEYYVAESKTTSEDIPPDNTGLIVGMVFVSIFLIAAIIGGAYYYKRIYQPKNMTSRRKDFNAVNFALEIKDEENPYETIELSRKIKLSNFDEEYEKLKFDSGYLLASEFESLDSVGSNQSTKEANLEENKTKNRYKNILPYDSHRVMLLNVSEEVNSDYINASYISGNNDKQEYIATQGPLPSTKTDFWNLVWEQNCRNIVMVTQVVEMGKTKCEPYWPFENSVVTASDITVTMTDETVMTYWITRQLVITKGSTSRNINHFHFTAWPDHGVPSTTESLVKFVHFVRSKINEETEPAGPTVVHCSAGVGRTGTFIAMDRLLQDLQNDCTSVDIYKIVSEMRMCRPKMVQTEAQYILLYEMVSDVCNKRYNPDEKSESPYENIQPIYMN